MRDYDIEYDHYCPICLKTFSADEYGQYNCLHDNDDVFDIHEYDGMRWIFTQEFYDRFLITVRMKYV